MSEKLLFTKEHEWIKIEGNEGYIGITDYAQSELGDIIFVELPQIDDLYAPNEVFGTIEAVKTVADLFMPVSSKIIEVNNKIEDNPETINEEAEGEGWIVKVKIEKMDDLKGLLTYEEYKELINE